MLSRLGEGALEKLQTTKNIAKQCLNRALGYADNDTEEKDPKEPPDKAAKEKVEQSMIFKRDAAYDEELETVEDEDDEDLVLITHQPCRVEIEKKPASKPNGKQEKFRNLKLGEERFEEWMLSLRSGHPPYNYPGYLDIRIYHAAWCMVTVDSIFIALELWERLSAFHSPSRILYFPTSFYHSFESHFLSLLYLHFGLESADNFKFQISISVSTSYRL